ncbi:hypothetical protein Tco_0249552, partial [Tanacetum coccineum]
MNFDYNIHYHLPCVNFSNALDALDASSVIIESNGTESKEQDTSSGIVSDEEIDKQKLEAHYSYMAKIQENKDAKSHKTTKRYMPVEKT